MYLVGSFARSVTVYSQQLRAIGLVDAMCGMGHLRRSTRAAVIGGGIAGLTAAAALAKIGVPVTIFEKEGSLIPLQSNSDKRYLHPRIYDWPLTNIAQVDAELPIMNWSAGRASDVAKHLKAQWDAIKAQATESVDFRRSEVQRLARLGDAWGIRTDNAGQLEAFDVVILCAGFGVESGTAFAYPYWADLPLDDPHIHSQNWLISGAGDGALTDLMRLCIKNFAHGDALRLVVETIERESGNFVGVLRERILAGMTGVSLFDGLPAQEISNALELRTKPVALNASEDAVFGTSAKVARSSVLNRLMARVLIAADRVTLLSGKIKADGIEGQRPDYRVHFSDPDRTLPFDDVLVRHGPDAPFGKPGARKPPAWMDNGLERDVVRMGRLWDSLYEIADPDPTTMRAHWAAAMFDGHRLAPDFRKHSGIVVYSEKVVGKESQSFPNGISAALRSKEVLSALVEATGETFHRPKVSPLRLEDALDGPRAVGRTIRALCEAPIAIFDATVQLPSLMFLLGVRAIVRRGVTVVVRVGSLNPADWQDLAFNLRELRIVPIQDRSGLEFERDVRTAVVEGLKHLARHPVHYSDLPAFAAIRNLGGDKDDYAARDGKEQVLVLCPFDIDYTRVCWPELQRALRDHWAPSTDLGPARRVIDLQSPELIARRLFDAVRRDVECVVDLTLNRPNVFFELGTRMVANENGARVIRCVDLPSADDSALVDEDRGRLDELLGPRPYYVGPTESNRVGDALRSELPWPGGTLTPSYWFAMAEGSVDARQEAGGRGVETLLWHAVEEAIGRDRVQAGGYPALYAGSNEAIQTQIREFAFHALLAYILLTDQLPPRRRDGVKRAIALSEIDDLFGDLAIDQQERLRLKDLIEELKRSVG